MGIEFVSTILRETLIMGEPVNWVKRRKECTLDQIFQGPLYSQLEKDIEEAGESVYSIEPYREVLVAGKRKEFAFEGGPPKEFVVRRRDRDGLTVLFRLKEDRIDVLVGSGPSFSVSLDWQDETAECGLLVRTMEEGVQDLGAKAELWQISQRALTELFFGIR